MNPLNSGPSSDDERPSSRKDARNRCVETGPKASTGQVDWDAQLEPPGKKRKMKGAEESLQETVQDADHELRESIIASHLAEMETNSDTDDEEVDARDEDGDSLLDDDLLRLSLITTTTTMLTMTATMTVRRGSIITHRVSLEV